MSGPEHYREAERLLSMLHGPSPDVATVETATALAVQAQVHATLALAAATALPPRTFLTTEFRDQLAAPWLEVAG